MAAQHADGGLCRFAGMVVIEREEHAAARQKHEGYARIGSTRPAEVSVWWVWKRSVALVRAAWLESDYQLIWRTRSAAAVYHSLKLFLVGALPKGVDPSPHWIHLHTTISVLGLVELLQLL